MTAYVHIQPIEFNYTSIK